MPIASAKITSKGQITLPAKLRKHLGLKPGDRLDFEDDGKSGVRLVAKTLTAHDLKGILKADIVLSDEELTEAISSAFGDRWKRFEDGDPGDDRG